MTMSLPEKTAPDDCPILQTFNQMQQLIENAAYNVLEDDTPYADNSWAASTAKRIATESMYHVDGGEFKTPEQRGREMREEVEAKLCSRFNGDDRAVIDSVLADIIREAGL